MKQFVFNDNLKFKGNQNTLLVYDGYTEIQLKQQETSCIICDSQFRQYHFLFVNYNLDEKIFIHDEDQIPFSSVMLIIVEVD